MSAELAAILKVNRDVNTTINNTNSIIKGNTSGGSTEMASNEDGASTNPNGFDLYSDEQRGFNLLQTDIDIQPRRYGTGELMPSSGWVDGEILEYSYRYKHTLNVTEAISRAGFLSIYADAIFSHSKSMTVTPSTSYFSGGGGGGGTGGGYTSPGSGGGTGTYSIDRTNGNYPYLAFNSHVRGTGGGGGSASGNGGGASYGGVETHGFGGHGGGGGGGGGGGTNGCSCGYYGGTGGRGGAGGAGGGVILIITRKLEGVLTLNAAGNGPGGTGARVCCGNNGGGGTAGGGGCITIITEEYSGQTTFNVTGGKLGAYAIWRRNVDNTLTLMVSSRNGIASDINGQTPVHGTDATIAW